MWCANIQIYEQPYLPRKVYHCLYQVNGSIVKCEVFCTWVFRDVCACVCLYISSSKGIGRLCCRQRYVVGGENTDISAGPRRFPQHMSPKFVTVIYSEPTVATQPASLMWATGTLKDMDTHTKTHILPPKQAGTQIQRYVCTLGKVTW